MRRRPEAFTGSPVAPSIEPPLSNVVTICQDMYTYYQSILSSKICDMSEVGRGECVDATAVVGPLHLCGLGSGLRDQYGSCWWCFLGASAELVPTPDEGVIPIVSGAPRNEMF
jgi:hypothetical protein